MKPDTDEPDHEPHIERMIERADYLRTERKDREREKMKRQYTRLDCIATDKCQANIARPI